MESDKKKSRVRLREFLFSGITSCLSVRRNDSQGCTADVKDTPPSPKEKPDDVIGPDIDPAGDHDDLRVKGSRLSIESFDSGVSFKSDWSIDVLINFKKGVSPSRLDLSSFEKKHDVSDDEGFFESPDSQKALRKTLSEPVKSGFHIPLSQQSPFMRTHRSVEAFGSGLTLMNDSFIRPRQDSLPRMVLRSMEACGSGLSLKSDSFIRTGQHSPPRMATGSIESSDSGVSLKSDQSKDEPFDFKDRVSPRSDFSSSVKKHVVSDDEGFFECSDDLARHEPGAVV